MIPDTIIAFDIETVRNARSRAYYDAKEYEAPSNYKDPDKIKAAIEEKRAADFAKAALTWWTAQICSIHASVVTDPEVSFGLSSDDEASLLIRFFCWLEDIGGFQLIGKSSADFDLPMLIGRAIALNIGIPSWWRANRSYEDVDQFFSRSHACGQRSSLENYAWGMGIDGKLGNGAQVQDLYEKALLSGDWNEMNRYCRRDKEIAAEMIRRFFKTFERQEIKQ